MKNVLLIFFAMIVFSIHSYSNNQDLIAEKAKLITQNIEGKQEKCIEITKWISSHICNHGCCYSKVNTCKSIDDWFINRCGECGMRGRIFVRMCKSIGIKANVFNLYNFGRVGGGHTAAQAFYNEKWHYFDPTYAGYFLNLKNDVLSWKEIKADPASAIKNMIILEDTCDYGGNYSDNLSKRVKIYNKKRMQAAYTPSAIKNADTGFYRKEIIWLTPEIDMNYLPLQIGVLNNSFTDVTSDGIKKGISEQLGVSLGTGTDMFHTKWKFLNAKQGQTYEMIYYVYKANSKNLVFVVEGKDIVVLKGKNFVTDTSLIMGKPEEWKITFLVTGKNPSLKIKYNFTEQQKLLFVDKIELKAITIKE